MEQTETNTTVPDSGSASRIPKSTKIAIAIAAAVLLVGVGYYIYSRMGSDPQEQARKEAEQIVAAVGKLMVLPTDEEPIIATVADPTQLAGQPFFQNAKIGDKVLIYNQARKAILYSPEFNKVVDVAPLSVGTPAPTPAK